MKSTLKLYTYSQGTTLEIPVRFWNFPSGEMGVRILVKRLPFATELAIIDLRYCDNEGLMAAILLEDAVRRMASVKVNLQIPYLPYGRQNRVCNQGEGLSLEVITDILTDRYDNVITVDPHAPVSGLRVDSVKAGEVATRALDHAGAFCCFGRPEFNDLIFCYPDRSAKDRFGFHQGLLAAKVRDPETGQVTQSVLDNGMDVAGQTVYILDDICDSGSTVKPVAKELKARGAKEVALYVTHGIFSKGVEAVLDGIDKIITTDSYWQGGSTDRIHVYPVSELPGFVNH